MERYQRPVDDRIPYFWRREYKKFTGVEPLYEEYEKHPDLWKKEPKMSWTFKFTMFLLFIILSFIYLVHSLNEERKNEIRQAIKEFYDSKQTKP